MDKYPLVSVIIPTYNSSRFIRSTIQSILDQSYKNFELLILDDHSNDDTLNILKSFQDNRIKIYENKINKGYVYSLNKLIKIAKGEYIARNDHDDISYHKRLEIQIREFSNNKNLSVCGGQIKVIGLMKKKISFPTDYYDIISMAFFNNPLHHPSVMIKSKIINKNQPLYNGNFCPCEDYHLWASLLQENIIINSNKILVNYRSHENNYSNVALNSQKEKNILIRKYVFKNLLKIDLPPEINSLFNKLIYNDKLSTDNLSQIKVFFELMDFKSMSHDYNKNLKCVMSFFWIKSCLLCSENANFIKKVRILLSYPNFSVIKRKYLLKKIIWQ